MVLLGSYPRSALASRRKPLPAAPAAVSISSVSATCTATITRWSRRPCELPTTRRALACATRPRSGRESWSAGHTPKTMAVTTARAVLKSSTGTFISMTDSAANELVGIQATMSARPFHAINTPNAVPATAITIASVSNCRTIRVRPAPSAARTASSCWRWAPRTSSRIDTLAQPTSRSDVTAPSSRKSRGPIGRAYSSMMLRRCTRKSSG